MSQGIHTISGRLGAMCLAVAMIAAWVTDAPAVENGADVPPEIAHLIAFVGHSGCDMDRNGSRHTAAEAASHLLQKYRRAKRYAPDAEQFIARIATGSSLSGKPYMVYCSAHPPTSSANWLRSELVRYRTEGDKGLP
ncbi:MAG: DUF5329 domain-containing protein [Nitrospirota bacterium]|nr:DUF5329 domain-containing protein [Nitrospirota bacterium]